MQKQQEIKNNKHIPLMFTSKYSSRLPPKSFGCPTKGVRPIRFLRNLWGKLWGRTAMCGEAPPGSTGGSPSIPRPWRIWSDLACRRAIRLFVMIYSENFCEKVETL